MRAYPIPWALAGALVFVLAGCGDGPQNPSLPPAPAPPANATKQPAAAPMNPQSADTKGAEATELAGTWVDTSGATYHINDDGTWDTETKQGKFATHISGTLSIKNRNSVWTTTGVEVTSSDQDAQDAIPDIQTQAEKDYMLNVPQNGRANEPNPNELVIVIGASGQPRTLDLKRDTHEQPAPE